MKKKLLLVMLTSVFVLGLLAAGCTPSAPPDETGPVQPSPEPEPTKVLTALCWLPADMIYGKHMFMYKDWVENYSDGRLVIDVKGNGEVIPTEEQIFAVGKGTIDMIFSCGDDISQGSPVGYSMVLTDMKPWEERERGIWDFYNETLGRDCNVHYLGQLMAPQWWDLFTNVKTDTPDDLKGLKIRSGATHFGSVEAVGAIPVTTPMGDIYTAMERGIVDGFVFPPIGWTQWGWQDVTKYWVGPRLVEGQNSTPLINLDVWNSLTKQEQDWLTQPIIDHEDEIYGFHYWCWAGDVYGEEAIVNAGVERIEWTDEENKWVQDTWSEALWDYVEGQMNSDDFARFEELVGHE
jgi:TRAP-type transport system periplasmic protein